MEKRLKDLKRALIIVRIMNTVASLFILGSILGTIIAVRSLRTDAIAIPVYVAVSIINLLIIFAGGWILDNTEGLQTSLQKRIRKLSRNICLQKARMESEKQACGASKSCKIIDLATARRRA